MAQLDMDTDVVRSYDLMTGRYEIDWKWTAEERRRKICLLNEAMGYSSSRLRESHQMIVEALFGDTDSGKYSLQDCLDKIGELNERS